MNTNLFQDPTEKQLQQQSDQLAKLQQQGEEQKKQLEAKLQHHFQEAIKELSKVIVHAINNSWNKTSGSCWWLLKIKLLCSGWVQYTLKVVQKQFWSSLTEY